MPGRRLLPTADQPPALTTSNTHSRIMATMSIADELQKLADLRRRGMLTADEFELAKRRLLTVSLPLGIRRQSKRTVAGWPLWAIASGPDPARGESRGHARAIVAIGDMATGLLAIGGFARGVIAFGGAAVGVISAGGLAIGLALAGGGAAVGGIALGGGALGGVAIGGGAAGRYAIGGAAAGTNVISAARCDIEAVDFFTRNREWIPLAGSALAQQSRTFARLCAPAVPGK